MSMLQLILELTLMSPFISTLTLMVTLTLKLPLLLNLQTTLTLSSTLTLILPLMLMLYILFKERINLTIKEVDYNR